MKESIEACIFPDYINFKYTSSDSYESYDHNYNVKLVTSKCNYGGVRYWFECPGCQSRRRTLYIRQSNILYERVLLCRECLNLTYRNRQTGKFMPNTSYWDSKGLWLYEKALRAMKPEKKAKFHKRAQKYYDGFWEILDKMNPNRSINDLDDESREFLIDKFGEERAVRAVLHMYYPEFRKLPLPKKRLTKKKK